MKSLTFLVALMLCLSPVLAVEQEISEVDAGTLPDSFLYDFDLLWENVELAFIFSNEARIKKLHEIDEERFAEMEYIFNNRGMDWEERDRQVRQIWNESKKNFEKLELMYKLEDKIDAPQVEERRERVSNLWEGEAVKEVKEDIFKQNSDIDKILESNVESREMKEIYAKIKEAEREGEEIKKEALENIDNTEVFRNQLLKNIEEGKDAEDSQKLLDLIDGVEEDNMSIEGEKITARVISSFPSFGIW